MSYYERLNENVNIEFRERYNHSDFVALLKKSEFVVTDGGSLQEETYFLGIPCLLLRKATERQNGMGYNVVMSNYDVDLVKNFCGRYKDFKLNIKKIDFIPSQLIINEVKKFV